ncbi:hypothetical protein [Leptothoe kymatousa]|uniref:PepSY domain-containing protein n=1 Tax=Leptothoe kymatousa TAU-MAC 1615 TaxID=2364775 RepID=A0ABS5Y4I8_9CYAN|nr:hypothetical protein [Leptothoe kymatousa]MBT9312418.1 hypothetical protein [Leptothoe kymatousa TAU-MAC 1615]
MINKSVLFLILGFSGLGLVGSTLKIFEHLQSQSEDIIAVASPKLQNPQANHNSSPEDPFAALFGDVSQPTVADSPTNEALSNCENNSQLSLEGCEQAIRTLSERFSNIDAETIEWVTVQYKSQCLIDNENLSDAAEARFAIGSQIIEVEFKNDDGGLIEIEYEQEPVREIPQELRKIISDHLDAEETPLKSSHYELEKGARGDVTLEFEVNASTDRDKSFDSKGEKVEVNQCED